MNDPLRNPLVIEPGELLAEVEVLDKGRAPLTDRHRVIGVLYSDTLICRQIMALVTDPVTVQIFKLRVPIAHGFLLFASCSAFRERLPTVCPR